MGCDGEVWRDEKLLGLQIEELLLGKLRRKRGWRGSHGNGNGAAARGLQGRAGESVHHDVS